MKKFSERCQIDPCKLCAITSTNIICHVKSNALDSYIHTHTSTSTSALHFTATYWAPPGL